MLTALSIFFCCSFFLQGVITTRKNLDRESPGISVDADDRGVYTLTVEAADHGIPVLRSTTTVNIMKIVSCYSKRLGGI